jgi:broad specificity phosphatase PhoE
MASPETLYFARHGETDWNAQFRLQGQTDIPLNAVGRAQAVALAAQLRPAGIAAIATSDLARARETAAIVSAELDVPITLVDPGFRERAYGIFEGLTQQEAEARDPAQWARFVGGDATSAGVEALADVARRMKDATLHAAKVLPSLALVVSHGRAMRELMTVAVGATIPPIPNGGVYRFVIVEGVFVSAEAVLRASP